MGITLLDTRGRGATDTAPGSDPGGLPAGGCSTPPRRAATRTISAPPVFVNGTEIMEEAIARELQHHPGEDVDTARAEAARALVIRHLLLERAHELALSPEPETDPLGRWESDEEALVRQVLEAEAHPAEPGPAEIDRVIAANPPPAALPLDAARRAVADRLRARAWLGASTRYVAGLARMARIEGLTLFAEDG